MTTKDTVLKFALRVKTVRWPAHVRECRAVELTAEELYTTYQNFSEAHDYAIHQRQECPTDSVEYDFWNQVILSLGSKREVYGQ